MPTTQLSVKLWHASARSAQLSSTLWMMTGLKTLSSKWPLAPAKPTVASFPMTWTQTMVMASHCVGFTLPGMMLLPGSFSGRCSSPMPQRGPLPEQAHVAGDLEAGDGERLASRRWRRRAASCPASAANLLGAVTNGAPGELGDLRGHAPGPFGWVLSPVPTAVPPSASS